MFKGKYYVIDPITHDEAAAALERNDPDELSIAVLAVALYGEDREAAEAYALQLAAHPQRNVRGNAVQGFGHIARRFGDMSPELRAVVWAALEDPDTNVRGQAGNAAGDINLFAGPTISPPVATADAFRALPPRDQRRVHLALCRDVLSAWTAYVADEGPIRYNDSIVGMLHEVDPGLPADALRSAEAGADLADVAVRYREPLSALQDDELRFPPAIELGYYALCNCFERYACGVPIDPWIIVQQALACPSAPADRLARAIRDTAG